MRAGVLVVVLFAFVPLVQAAEPPGYVVETTPTKTVEAVFSYSVQAPKLVAKEWIVFAPRLPEVPAQSRLKSTLEPGGKNAEDLSELRRPLIVARVPGKGREASLKLNVRYEATLHARKLVPLQPGMAAPVVPALTGAARAAALRTSTTLDHEAAAFQKWLDKHALRKRGGEGDVDFARRVFLHISKQTAYEYTPNLKREASSGCQGRATDCGGMSVLFVATLRANKVPARVLVGRWAESAKRGEKLGEVPYSQQHAKAEFYADGVGWVPVDLSSAVLHDKSREGLQFFANDPGDFIVLHVDPDLLVDTVHFGKKEIAWLQSATFWVTGGGTLDMTATTEDWQVTAQRK
jgi:hypothetical protein